MILEEASRQPALSVANERAVLDAVSDCAIFAVGSDGCVTHWNAGAKTLLGYEEAEALGKPVTAFVVSVASTPTRRFSELLAAVGERPASDGSGCCVHKDGSHLRT